MKTSSSASGKNASKPSQRKPDAQHKTSRPVEQPASTVILDATPPRPGMLQWLTIIAIVMSGFAIAVSLYPVMRPIVGPILGLAMPVPEWQLDIAALRKEDIEYRASTDAERIQLVTMMTAIEQKIQLALSEGQSAQEAVSSLRTDIKELHQRIDVLEGQKNTSHSSFETSSEVSEQATPNELARSYNDDPANSYFVEESRSSLWDKWTGGWSLLSALDFVGELFNLTRVDEAPPS